jgi:guanine deaminase
MSKLDTDLLRAAIIQSEESVRAGGYPVGALLAKDDRVEAVGLSNGKQDADPTAHAETTAIRLLSAKLGQRSLKGYALYSSMEPCLMCFSAAFWAQIDRVVYGVSKERLSWQHSEGNYDLVEINKSLRRPLELVHLAELESEALATVDVWERDHPVV